MKQVSYTGKPFRYVTPETIHIKKIIFDDEEERVILMEGNIEGKRLINKFFSPFKFCRGVVKINNDKMQLDKDEFDALRLRLELDCANALHVLKPTEILITNPYFIGMGAILIVLLTMITMALICR